MQGIKIVFLSFCLFALLIPDHLTSALDCPKAPEQAGKDWEVEINAAVARIGPVKGGELNTKTRKATLDLLGKLPDAGNVYIEQMMFSAYCTALRDDKTLPEKDKAVRLQAYSREVRKAIKEKPPIKRKVKKDSMSQSAMPASNIPKKIPKQLPKKDGTDEIVSASRQQPNPPQSASAVLPSSTVEMLSWDDLIKSEKVIEGFAGHAWFCQAQTFNNKTECYYGTKAPKPGCYVLLNRERTARIAVNDAAKQLHVDYHKPDDGKSINRSSGYGCGVPSSQDYWLLVDVN